ncbi:MAG: hypothetical protein A2Z14_12830 [Chloroflexi bacterium RBG_16_48_8]|nr:MAG: hypothetical protein A2Z14_12830 [Chloroflexi bacterium RBG_16_48_8]
MIRPIFPLLLTILTIAACTEATVLPTSTLTPPTSPPTSSPTFVSQTGTPQPFTTTTPVIVIEDPNVSFTPTPVPLPISLPKEKVAILRPASGSNVTSPFRVNGYAGPSWNNRVELRLIGEDGRLISKTIAYLLSLPGNAGPFTAEMEFETTLIAETARLEVSTFSTEDTKLDHMASVDLILLSIGAPLTHWTIHGPEQITILSPREYDTIRAGRASVKGVGWVNLEGPLHLDVLDGEGNVVGTTLVQIDSNGPGMAGTFEVEVQYQIDEAQLGRVAIYETCQTIPGIIHYASVIVNLRP